VEQLKKQTEQAEKGKWGETPVKLANIMRRTKEDTQETVLLKEAVQATSRLRSDFRDLAMAVLGSMTESFDRASKTRAGQAILANIESQLRHAFAGGYGFGAFAGEGFPPVAPPFSAPLKAQPSPKKVPHPDEPPKPAHPAQARRKEPDKK